MGFLSNLELLPYVIITLLIAFTAHEFAHAYVAYKFGDNTAQRQGRLTLNPIKHLDPIGTILIIIAGFGWAKPVPVNRFHFKNPRLAGVLVSIAGPISNLLLAALALLIFFVSIRIGILGLLPAFYQEGLDTFLNIFVSLNVMLFLFNLLPFPPLDGYRIIEDLVPATIRPKLAKLESFGIVIFLVLVITPLGNRTLFPLLHNGINRVISFLITLFQPIL